MKQVIRVGILSVSLLSLSAFGEEAAKPKYQHPAYGMAGCGLGSVILKENTQGMQILAGTTNPIYGTNTFAMTTGSSNCVEHTPSYAKLEQEVYIGANLNDLKADAARGQGARLTGLAEVFGCADVDAFGKVSQSKFETIFAGTESNHVVENYHQVLSASSLRCSRVVSAG